MVVFHLFEYSTGWVRGGWLGVDLFFVLSGFLITSLLIAEHGRWGHIDLWSFWLARARRLLPALVLMLSSVVVVSAFWIPVARRTSTAWDIASALSYSANWRLLLSDDQYFATLALPSPVRHTWSLAIEEQFYLLFPLLLVLLLLITARRKYRNRLVAVALLMLAATSAWLMATLYVPNVDPARVYYGTDTRAFELLIGAAFGMLLTDRGLVDRGIGGRRRPDRLAELIQTVARWAALPALAVLIVALFALDESSAFPFRGGLAALALIAMAPIIAGAQRRTSRAARLLSFEPLRRLGVLSYSLYLWHWPVIVFADEQRLALPAVPRAVVQLALSLALAYLTHRYIEHPVHRGGLRALLPRRPRTGRVIAVLLVPLLAAGIIALPRFEVGAAAPSVPADQVVDFSPPAYNPLAAPHSVTLVGNSVPASLAQAYPVGEFADLSVSDDISFGCDPFPGDKVIDHKVVPAGASCPEFRRTWQESLRTNPPTLAIFMVPQTLVDSMRINGKSLPFGSSAYRSWLARMLGTLRKQALAAGADHFAVTTLSCHRMPALTTELKQVNDDKRVAIVNDVVRSWAAGSGTPVLDLQKFLCGSGYRRMIDGTPLYQDGLHFTAESGAVVWRWMAPQIQQIVRGKS